MKKFKKCGNCGEVRQLKNFYKNESSKDGLNYECIDCAIERSSRNREKGSEVIASTQRAITTLVEQGIPCMNGTLAGFPYTDLAAWGCVPIEAKESNEGDTPNKFQWMFTPKQRKRDYSGYIFLLMAIYKNGETRTFVCPAELFTDNLGRLKNTAITVTLNSNYHNAFVYDLIKNYENNFYQIEKTRIEVSKNLMSNNNV